MAQLQIRPFEPADEQAVIDVILPIQREEFGVAVTVDDQPDLREIPDFYQSGRGNFWVAEVDGRVVGTIGLKDIGEGRTALRKMFVAAAWRGRECGLDRAVAQSLLDRLLRDAIAGGVTAIFLGTTEKFLAAHRFYEKNGFALMDASGLPAAFPRMAVDTRFYCRRLAPATLQTDE